jgi:hypothetical protein
MVKRSNENESDNFIRRDLKRRFKGYRRPKKSGVKPRNSLDRLGESSTEGSSGSEDDNEHNGGRKYNGCTSSRANDSSAAAEPSCGGSLGLDPLLLSLDAYHHFDSASGTLGSLDTADQKLLDHAAQQAVSSVAVSEVDYRNKKDIEEDSLASFKLSRNKTIVNKDLYERLSPKCPGHSLPMKLLVVKKEGRNKGRKFYGCAYPADQR